MNFLPFYNVSFSGISNMFIIFHPFPGELLFSAVYSYFAVCKVVAKCLRCLDSDCSLQWLNALSEQRKVLLFQQ